MAALTYLKERSKQIKNDCLYHSFNSHGAYCEKQAF